MTGPRSLVRALRGAPGLWRVAATLRGHGYGRCARIEAFAREAPGDARRVLRRLADGTLGRLQAPDLEARVERVGKAVERLTGGVLAGSFVVGGALLSGLSGWHHRAGVVLLGLGIVLAIMVGLSARGWGLGRIADWEGR